MLTFYLTLIDTKEEKSKFVRLYEKYGRLMFYIANKILKNQQDAEDAVGEAFIKIIKNIDKIDESKPIHTKNFLSAVVKNTSLTMLKGNSKNIAFEDIDDVEIESEDYISDILTEIEYNRIVESILSLPDLYKQIFYLKLVHENTVLEISNILNLPIETVKKRLQRGRKVLLEQLEKEGVTGNE